MGVPSREALLNKCDVQSQGCRTVETREREVWRERERAGRTNLMVPSTIFFSDGTPNGEHGVPRLLRSVELAEGRVGARERSW